MKRVIVLIIVLVIYCFTHGQEKKITLELTKALVAYDKAKDTKGMEAATQLFKNISDNNKNEWLAAYWTSFLYTQTGRMVDEQLPYYEKSQTYIDRAFKAKKSFTSSEKSELYALQHLINNLTSGPYWRKGDRENGMKYSNLKRESLNQAIIYNSENPRIYLLTGMGLINDGKRNQDTGYIFAGKVMLKTAKLKYKSEESESKVYPNWGEGWINFWLANSKLPLISQDK